MEIIEELEPVRRGVYGGAVGYFGFSGNMDTAIAIRTMVMRRRARSTSRPGPASSPIPTRSASIAECVNKARALFQAVKLAESM